MNPEPPRNDPRQFALPPTDEPTGFGSRLVHWLLLGIGGILLIPLLPFCVRIVSEYERGVIFRVGRLIGAKGRASSSSCRSSTAW
jgi:hypothetical protein